MNKIVDAMWSVHLFVTCPHCGEHFDMLDTPDFWNGRSLEYCENSEHQIGECIACKKEFDFRCKN